MRIIASLVGMLLVYLFYGVYLSHFDLRILSSDFHPKNPDGFYDYAGVVNVHSIQSTGSGTYEEIITAAKDSKLDFIFITDLNPLSAPDKSLEGYRDGVLVFVDGEFSYINSRLLYLDVAKPREWQGLGRAQMFFADLLSRPERKKAEGVFVLAHPLRPRFTWSGDYPAGLDGIEIINLKSQWQNAWLNDKLSFIWSLLVFPFNDRLALLRLFQDPVEEVRLWDTLTARRPTLGVAGTDAESRIRISDEIWLNYPSYQSLFSLVRNHVLLTSELTGNPARDREKIAGALRSGNFYVSLDILNNPKGFSAKVVAPNGETFSMGATIPWREGLELAVHLPEKPSAPFETEIYKDGTRMLQSNSQETRVSLHEPGNYRVKVRVIPTLPLPDGKKWIPWIFTNPFHVIPNQAAER